jgi:hypothetical protein
MDEMPQAICTIWRGKKNVVGRGMMGEREGEVILTLFNSKINQNRNSWFVT